MMGGSESDDCVLLSNNDSSDDTDNDDRHPPSFAIKSKTKPNLEEKVTCPVCSQSFAPAVINGHIDGCLSVRPLPATANGTLSGEHGDRDAYKFIQQPTTSLYIFFLRSIQTFLFKKKKNH